LRRQWPGLSILPKLWDLFYSLYFATLKSGANSKRIKDESVGERSAMGEA
jgi:hypothetical protein